MTEFDPWDLKIGQHQLLQAVSKPHKCAVEPVQTLPLQLKIIFIYNSQKLLLDHI